MNKVNLKVKQLKNQPIKNNEKRKVLAKVVEYLGTLESGKYLFLTPVERRFLVETVIRALGTAKGYRGRLIARGRYFNKLARTARVSTRLNTARRALAK